VDDRNPTAQQEDGSATGNRKAWDVLGDFTTTTRVIPISALAILIGTVAAFVALALLRLIGLFTNLLYFGVLTRGDIRKHVAQHGESALRQTLGELVRTDVVSAHPDESLRYVVYRMAEKGFTRMPVVDRDTAKFRGLISLDDLLTARTRRLEEERRRERTLKLRFLRPGGKFSKETDRHAAR